MTVELLVPTLGESVVEATVAKWMKSPEVGTNNSTVISILLRSLIFILLLKQC